MKTFFIICLTIGSFTMLAQQNPEGFKRKSMFVELFANSSNSLSFNFENVFSGSRYVKFGYRIGVGGLVPTINSVVVPAGIFLFTGNKNSHVEFGTGLTYLYSNFRLIGANDETLAVNSSLVVPLSLGYRYQTPGGGLFYKINISCTIHVAEFGEYVPPDFFASPGIVVGYSF